MRFRTTITFVGLSCCAGITSLASGHERRQLTFAEKAAPAVKKQLEYNYPHDPEIRDRLFKSWQAAHGLKLAAEEHGSQLLKLRQASTEPQTRKQKTDKLLGVIAEIDRHDQEKKRLIGIAEGM